MLLTDELLEDLTIAFLLGQETGGVEVPRVPRPLLSHFSLALDVLRLEITEERGTRLQVRQRLA